MMEERLYDRSDQLREKGWYLSHHEAEKLIIPTVGDIPCLMIMCHSNLGHLRTERWILKEAGIESPTLIIGG